MCKFTKNLYPLMQMLLAFSFYCCMVHMVQIFLKKKYKSIQELKSIWVGRQSWRKNLFYVNNKVAKFINHFIIIEVWSLLIINNKLMLIINQKRTNKNTPITLLWTIFWKLLYISIELLILHIISLLETELGFQVKRARV